MGIAISNLLLEFVLTSILASTQAGCTGKITVSGRVTDEQQGALPGVTVEAVNAKGTPVCTLITGTDGYYALRLSPGTYDVNYTLQGFVPERRTNLAVELRTLPPDQNVTMGSGFVSESITVTAVAPVATPTPGTSVPASAIRALRIFDTGRTVATWLTALTSEALPTVFHFRPELTVAGAAVPDAIARSGAGEGAMRILIGALPAEYSGGSAGMVIDLPEEAVGNDIILNGTAHVQPTGLREEQLDVAAPFGIRTESSQRDLQIQASSPLIEDQAFIFGVYRVDQQRWRSRSAAAVEGEADSSDSSANVRVSTSTIPLFDTVRAQVALTKRTSDGFIGDALGHLHGDLQSLSNRREEKRFAGTVSGDLTIGTSVHSISGDVREDTDSFVGQDAANHITQRRDPSGGFFVSQGTGWFLDEAQRLAAGISAKSSLSLRRHDVRLGASVSVRELDYRSGFSGGYLADVESGGVVALRTFTLDGQPVAERNDDLSRREETLYLQDEFSFSRLKINAGVRWQNSTAERSGLRMRTSAFLPRIGAAWDFDEDSDSRLFASYSVYLDEVPDSGIISLLTRYGFARTTAGRRELFPSASFVDPDLRPSILTEVTAGYSQSIGEYYASVSLMRRESRDDVVLAACVLAPACIGNPGRGILRTIPAQDGQPLDVPQPRRDSDTLRIEIGKRGRNPFELRYIHARHRGNHEPRLFPQTFFGFDPYADVRYAFGDFARRGEGPLHADRRHTVLFTGSYGRFPLQAAWIAYWQSGSPVSRYGVSDFFGSYTHLLGQRGSEGRTPAVWDADLNISYDIGAMGYFEIRIEASVQNVFNRQRPLVVDERWSFLERDNLSPAPTNPSFGQPILRTPPRTITFGIRLVSVSFALQ